MRAGCVVSYQTEFHPVIQREMGASNLPVNWDEKLAQDVTMNNKSQVPWKTHLRCSPTPSRSQLAKAPLPPAPQGAATWDVSLEG